MKKDLNIKMLDITAIIPDNKDIERATGLQFKGRAFKGDCSGYECQAIKMAKLIKDPIKLIRRAKAVVKRYGAFGYMGYGHDVSYCIHKDSDVFKPFAIALTDMGFTYQQIKQIIETAYDLK